MNENSEIINEETKSTTTDTVLKPEETDTQQPQDETVGRRSALNSRRRSMLEKQQKKQEEEAEKEQPQQTTRRTRRRRQESTNDDLDVDEDDEAKDVQQVAKRPCLSQSRRAFPVQTTAILEKAFNVSSYPSETEITSLCESTRLTDKQVFYFIFFV